MVVTEYLLEIDWKMTGQQSAAMSRRQWVVAVEIGGRVNSSVFGCFLGIYAEHIKFFKKGVRDNLVQGQFVVVVIDHHPCFSRP